MIKNIVFDIGNVLVDFNVKGFLAGKGFAPDMIRRIVKASLMSPYWEAFERCDLDEAGALKAFASLDPEIESDIFKENFTIDSDEFELFIKEYNDNHKYAGISL